MWKFLISLSIALVSQLVESQELKCKWTDHQTEMEYDFNPLSKNDADYYLAKDSAPNLIFDCWLNMCRSLITDTCGASDVAGCAKYGPQPGGKYSIGKASTLTFMRGQALNEDGYGATAVFSGGIQGRTMTIDFTCDEGAGAGSPVFMSETGRQSFRFKWVSVHACPVGRAPDLSIGSIMLIVFGSLVITYVIAGILWNKYKRGLTGLELVPQGEFWISIPGLVKDGVVFIINKIKNRGGGSTTFSYSQL